MVGRLVSYLLENEKCGQWTVLCFFYLLDDQLMYFMTVNLQDVKSILLN